MANVFVIQEKGIPLGERWTKVFQILFHGKNEVRVPTEEIPILLECIKNETPLE